ncbi:MAG: hypothetical protein LBQ24_07570 [Candidatus Peribacteria bacterium]|jgi:hypothetical protein|nr:hypothetical protein [Candidatus Peribacteria bacterium]
MFNLYLRKAKTKTTNVISENLKIAIETQIVAIIIVGIRATSFQKAGASD